MLYNKPGELNCKNCAFQWEKNFSRCFQGDLKSFEFKLIQILSKIKIIKRMSLKCINPIIPQNFIITKFQKNEREQIFLFSINSDKIFCVYE